MFRILLVASLLVFAHGEDEHGHDDEHGHEDEHGHGGDEHGAWEWAGTFDTPDQFYMWTAQKVDGDYADPKMKLVVFASESADEVALEALVPAAELLLESGNCTDTHSDDVISPGMCANLVFDQHVWQTLFTVTTTKADGNRAGHLAFFAQHVPTEFENTAHYLKDSTGEDIEPVSELPHEEEPDKPWGEAIGAAILVNIVTCTGVILLIPGVSALVKRYDRLFHAYMSAFAAGALLSCAFFLLLFEATHLVAAYSDEEGEVTFRWGIMVLAGFITSFVIDACVEFVMSFTSKTPGGDTRTDAEAGVAMGDVNKDGAAVTKASTAPVSEDEITATFNTRVRVLSGVLIGDFMHNFCDGIFMGTAFRYCSSSLAWNIAAATIGHEIAQEISDYVVLTNPAQGGLKPAVALLLNFLSGTSVLFGVIAILGSDEIGDYAVGMLLAFGGGVYVQIGAAECMPRVFINVQNFKERAGALSSFCIGALAIGLVLLDHQHCSAGGGGHAGHNH